MKIKKTYLRYWRKGYSHSLDVVDCDIKKDREYWEKMGYDELRYFELKEMKK